MNCSNQHRRQFFTVGGNPAVVLRLGLVLFLAVFSGPDLVGAPGHEHLRELDLSYRIERNGKKIGGYRFEVRESAGVREVSVEMQAEVRILWVPVYSIRHQRRDVWHGDALQQTKGWTRYKGDRIEIQAELRDETMHLRVNGELQQVEPPLVTFVPWLIGGAENSRLLTEKARVRDVRRERLGQSEVEVAGRSLELRHVLYSGPWVRHAWYDESGWLRLMEYEKDGATIRIVLESEPDAAPAAGSAAGDRHAAIKDLVGGQR